jgi:hypothetical protein
MFDNLFLYKKIRIYDNAKSRKDDRLNIGYDYTNEPFLARMLSRHIIRNQTLNEFLIFIDDYIFNLLKGVKVLKSYKNYTVKKDDKYIR